MINYNDKYSKGRCVEATCTTTTVVFFANHMRRFLDAIEKLKPATIVGCMYMFTEPIVLQTLIDKKIPVNILVDRSCKCWATSTELTKNVLIGSTTWKKHAAIKLRLMYNQLTPKTSKAIQTIGVIKNATALMHHKFFVFLDDANQPIAVWTGSVNFTKNSALSLENAMLCTDVTIAKIYYDEWYALNQHAENLR